MGDSGALLLGFLLATLAIEGLVKTAALATLVLPLLVLAIPIVDTSFVVAKRLKYRQPLYEADRTHLHHRFMNIGFSQKRAVVYMYAWCGILAAAALSTRFLPPRPGGEWDISNALIAGGMALLAVVASVYIAYLLEIIKLANPRIRRREERARDDARRSA
jgi:UDP-GlcNAc:undecaprenyl-phosphate GlcNAc-1-phosphate transferase